MPAPIRIESPSDTRFIGRRIELDALHAALQRALSGAPRIVLLAGEPGIGKTRTAQELIVQARRHGMLALCGRCPEEPGAPPYWPWLQMTRRYAALHDDGELAAAIGPAAAQLAALDAELGRRLQASPASAAQEQDPVKARFQLFDAIAGMWQRAAERQPLLLVFDDLHRADVPSLRLLEFVMAEAGDSRLMVLGTYRDTEVGRHHPLSDTLAQLHRHGPVQRLLLGGFTAAETAQFVSASGLTASAAALHDQTEGHPLFLAEVLRDLRQKPGAHLPRIPHGVREVIGARLNRLSPRCVDVLQHAAVIGREFRFELLHHLLGTVPEEEGLAAIEEARSAGLIEGSDTTGGFQFAHALFRDALDDELPAPTRARMHQRIAAALEAQHRGDLTPCLSALAHHHHAAGPAGDSAKAIEYAILAAERATAMQAHEEAARLYRLACSALGVSPEADRQRGRILLGLGHAQNSAGDSALALDAFAGAADCARRTGDGALLARAAIGFGNAQSLLGHEGSRAAALIGEALASTCAADERQRASLLGALCGALLFSNRPDEAEAAYREAVSIARRVGDAATLFSALAAIVPGRWFADRLSLRIEAAREAIEIACRSGHPEWAAGYLMGWHTGDLMEAGDTAGAKAAALFRMSSEETTRQPLAETVSLAALAMIATHEGRFAEAERFALKALRRGTRVDPANAHGIFSVQMFTLRRHQGRLAELAPVLGQFRESRAAEAAWHPGLAILHCELGERDEAREVFERCAAGDFSGIPRDALWTASLAYLSEVCVWLRDTARAATLFDLLLPHARRNIVLGANTASFGSAARLLGMLAATLGRWDAARQHFEVAMVFDAGTAGRPWLAQTRCEFAAMLVEQGDDLRRAGMLIDASLAEARVLGMRRLVERAFEIRQRLAASRGSGERTAGLSRREVEVLRLIAAGKTNQEIARCLFRSPNTVAIHVRNILDKTGSANRAEAAAFAVRQGLMPSE